MHSHPNTFQLRRENPSNPVGEWATLSFWTCPDVTLIASTQPSVNLPHWLSANEYDWSPAGSPDLVAEFAGRLCYLSFDKRRPGGREAYFQNILESGHGSVLEHVNYTFVIQGVSRTLTHELVRHRHFSYSQVSQRFVGPLGISFVVPPLLLEQLPPNLPESCPAFMEWVSHCHNSLREYARLAEAVSAPEAKHKQIRETARSVLPGCTETKIVVTGNVRAWRHFIELRSTIHADAEIRRLAIALARTLMDESPVMFQDYRIEETDGGPILDVLHKKV